MSDNNAESGKVPRMLAAFPRWIAREILSKKIIAFSSYSPDIIFLMKIVIKLKNKYRGVLQRKNIIFNKWWKICGLINSVRWEMYLPTDKEQIIWRVNFLENKM
jgi:hypothetical protein